MALRVYNTLSRQIEEFRPLREGEVSVYVCGLTVYDYMHIGHARTYIAFDVILRHLKSLGYRVTYVQNITDVDDKIINRALERGVPPLELSKEFSERASEDRKNLGLLEPDVYPKVSEHIPDIIDAVRKLIDSGHAYSVGGSVYFDVSTFPDYGRLSNQKTEELDRHRVEHDSGKRSPLDFSLWKESSEDELGFDSLWGRGRPGWHIECSVMSQKYLGDRFDIHGGALDLIFPHHENEIAQSESLSGKKPFVRYWLHTGFLNSTGEKMSKSLGNIISVRDFLKGHSASALRLFVLQTNYRSPIDYSSENVAKAESALKRLGNFRRALGDAIAKSTDSGDHIALDVMEGAESDFIGHMNNDFNTSQAVASLFDAVKRINPLLDGGNESAESIKGALDILGRLLNALGITLPSEAVELTEEESALVEKRRLLRLNKKWAEADRIRDELLRGGLALTDQPDGSTLAERVKAVDD
ncbi:MAG: cysteine--tRNA ligase [Candidatus Altiarchaeota archaeon]